MTYQEATKYLFESLPMYQRIGKSAYKADLENALAMDRHFLSPHERFRCIHIAGTNGKGSVSHMLAAVLQKAGFNTGLYTSPHLLDFRERIKINGKPVSKEYVCDFVSNNREVFEKLQPSFFEMSVFMAFCWFEAEQIDIAVIETGLGGRLDTTNIIHPEVSVITNIGMDHMQFLGNSLAEIAGEKAGIMKKGVPVVVGRTQEEINVVFTKKANELDCKLHYADHHFKPEYGMQNPDAGVSWHIKKPQNNRRFDLTIDLRGSYQKENLVTCLQTIEVLKAAKIKIPDHAIREGLENVSKLTGLMGRWQIVGHNPLQVCDIAHNQDGIKHIVEQIDQTPHKELHMVLGFVDDKNIGEIVSLLPHTARYYLCEPKIPRAMKLEELKSCFSLDYVAYSSVEEAYNEAYKQAGENDMIYIGGSAFVVSDFLQFKKI